MNNTRLNRQQPLILTMAPSFVSTSFCTVLGEFLAVASDEYGMLSKSFCLAQPLMAGLVDVGLSAVINTFTLYLVEFPNCSTGNFICQYGYWVIYFSVVVAAYYGGRISLSKKTSVKKRPTS
jgi:hypothetical protein